MGINANYMTLNPLYLINNSYPPATNVIRDGNLTLLNATSNYGIGMTNGFYSGKWYWEILLADKGQFLMGFITTDTFNGQQSQPHNKTGSYLVYTSTAAQGNQGYKVEETSFITINNFNAGDGDIVGFALDRDNRKLWVSLNGTFINSGDPAGGSNPVFDSAYITATTGEFRPILGTYGAQNVKMTLNAGQDSSFVGQKTSGSASATDDNGFGDFYYTPPTGFLSPCSNNIPMNTNQDPAEDTPPNNYFEVVTYSGTGSTKNITSLNFQPDMVWIKNRDQADSWCVQDDINGVGKTKAMDSASAYASESNCITSFNSDGFSLGNNHKVNASGENYVAYCFKESQEAGLDMFSYTGVGDGTAPFSHNLGETPKMVWIFLVSGSATDTMVYMDVPDMGYSYGIFPSLSNARQATSYVAATSSSSITVGSSANATGRGYFAMLWAEREGFSKYGQYTGNGNADGPFIYTGFRPRFLWIKNINSASSWQARDTARKTFNVHDTTINFESNTTETTNSNHNMDFLSNGFKLRTTLADYNENGSEFIFAAWADVPFKYNNTF